MTIYFEQPNREKTDFYSVRINFPGGRLRNVKGYTKELAMGIMGYVHRPEHTALKFAKDETNS